MGGIELTIILVMIAVTGVFASYEIALAAVSLARLQVLVNEKNRGADAALFMKENMEASFAVVQLGMTLAGTIAAATGGAEVKEQLMPLIQSRLGISPGQADIVAIGLLVVPLTAVTLLFGELIPKVFGLRNKEWLCLKLSPSIRWFARGVRPAVWLLEKTVTAIRCRGERLWRPRLKGEVSDDAAELRELRASAALARTCQLIGNREEGIILGATDLTNRPLRTIMLPVDHINMLDASASLVDSLRAAHRDMHTRFPIAEVAGNPQTIIGYITFKDMVACLQSVSHPPSLKAVLRPILGLHEELSISKCLEWLLREHTHIALIRDAANRVVGMITLEDILEEMVGDIQDEYDRLPTHEVTSENNWVVGGGISLTRLKEMAAIDLSGDLPSGGAESLNDWIIGHLGHQVHDDDVLERHGLRFKVCRVRRHKIQEAQISRTTAAGPTLGI